jgi:hypothetical protein
LQLKLLKRGEAPETAPAIIEIPLPSLRDFCSGDDELYEALEYFLLIEPREKNVTFGSISGWLAEGDAQKAKGDKLTAMVAYECAARIACYRDDKETTRKALILADAMNPKPKQASVHKILLARLDKVFEIAEEFYKAELERAQKLSVKKQEIAALPLSN